ncbi:hypothetical protein Peur_055094 [Populus x canadensis]
MTFLQLACVLCSRLSRPMKQWKRSQLVWVLAWGSWRVTCQWKAFILAVLRIQLEITNYYIDNSKIYQRIVFLP